MLITVIRRFEIEQILPSLMGSEFISTGERSIRICVCLHHTSVDQTVKLIEKNLQIIEIRYENSNALSIEMFVCCYTLCVPFSF